MGASSEGCWWVSRDDRRRSGGCQRFDGRPGPGDNPGNVLNSSHKRARAVPTLPRAVFFDFDGVLADTENIHIAAWERTFGDLGWDVPPADCARAAEVDD